MKCWVLCVFSQEDVIVRQCSSLFSYIIIQKKISSEHYVRLSLYLLPNITL